VAEDPVEVRSEWELGPALERRDGDLVDQLAEIGGLGQDLDVEERGGRLQRDRRQLVAAMEAARRVHVVHGHGEDQLPGEPAEPSAQPLQQAHPPRADDVVAVIDRLEQGIEVRRGPGRAGRRHQHERHDRPGEPAAYGRAPANRFGHDDDGLHGAPPRRE
jgi:hypothetical protein